jgi:hypothetical protein
MKTIITTVGTSLFDLYMENSVRYKYGRDNY